MTRHVTSPRVDSGHSHAPRVLDPRLSWGCAALYSIHQRGFNKKQENQPRVHVLALLLSFTCHWSSLESGCCNLLLGPPDPAPAPAPAPTPGPVLMGLHLGGAPVTV